MAENLPININISNGHLVVVHSEKFDINEVIERKVHHWNYNDASYLITYSPILSPSGGSSICKVLNPIINTPLFANEVRKILVYSRFILYDHRITTLVYELKTSVVEKILLYDNIDEKDKPISELKELSKQIFTLIEETFPSYDYDEIQLERNKNEAKLSKPIDTVNYKKLFSEKKLKYDYDSEDRLKIGLFINNDINRLGKNFCDTKFHKDFVGSLTQKYKFRFPQTGAYSFNYVIEIEEVSAYTNNSFLSINRLIVFIDNSEETIEQNFYLTTYVQGYIKFLEKIVCLKILSLQSSQLTSNLKAIQEEVLKDYKIQKKYSDNYLKFRFNAKREIYNITTDVESTTEYLIKKFPYFIKKDKEFETRHNLYEIVTWENYYMHSVIKRRLDKFDNLVNDIKSSITEFNIYDSTLNEAVKDVYNSDVIKANFRIQYSVKRLTYIAIFIGLLSFIATIFQKEIHDYFSELIHKLFDKNK